MHAEETTPAYWCSATAQVSMRIQMRNDTTVAQMWSEAAIRQACTDQRFGTTTRAAVLQYLHHASVVFAQLCVLPLVLDQRAGLVPLDSCGVGGDYLDRNAPRWCSPPPGRLAASRTNCWCPSAADVALRAFVRGFCAGPVSRS